MGEDKISNSSWGSRNPEFISSSITPDSLSYSSVSRNGDLKKSPQFVCSLDNIIRPNQLKHKIEVCTWSYVSLLNIELILNSHCSESLETALCYTVPDILDYENNPNSAILMETYKYIITFCKEREFRPQQLATVLTILKRTFEITAETPFNNMKLCYEYFRDMLVCHSHWRPPFSADIFTVDEAEHVMKYFVETFFKHFRLYKYIFTSKLRLDLIIQYDDDEDSDEISEEDKVGGEEEENDAMLYSNEILTEQDEKELINFKI